MPLAKGTQIGPYEILTSMGSGGMGEVWKARDTRLNRLVAIKVSKEQFSERFEREARAVAALNHPNICTLHDVGPNYLVMEYVEGEPLKGPLPLEKVQKYGAQICMALEAAHKKGIVHCDLKPANILVAKAGVKLLDFGLARIASGSADTTVTIPGQVVGTPAYMSPEQWDGKPGDARTDIYALGCVLYEVLTGKRAAAHRAAVEPAWMQRVIGACMEKDPDERWQSARDVRRALEQSAAEQATARNPWREQAAWIAAAAAVAVALFFALRPALPTATWHLSINPPERMRFFPQSTIKVRGSLLCRRMAEWLPSLRALLAPDLLSGSGLWTQWQHARCRANAGERGRAEMFAAASPESFVHGVP